MKYIIDLPNTCQWVQWINLSDKDGHAYFDFKSPEDLTPLDKELSSELGEAYHKGFEAGSHEATTLEHQQGLNDAWGTIIKIALIPYAERSEIFDGQQDIISIVQKFSPSEVAAKLREYEQQKADAKIKVGDEVKDRTDDCGVVTWIYGNDAYVLWQDGSTGNYAADELIKTGRHFNFLASLLNAMKEGAE